MLLLKQFKETKMTFNDLNRFQKFCFNRMGFKEFLKFSGMTVNDDEEDAYVMSHFKAFQNNPVDYVTRYSNKTLFNNIWNYIVETDYQG